MAETGHPYGSPARDFSPAEFIQVPGSVGMPKRLAYGQNAVPVHREDAAIPTGTGPRDASNGTAYRYFAPRPRAEGRYRYHVPLFRPRAPRGRALTVPRTVKRPPSGQSWPSWPLQRYRVPLFRPGAPCGRALTVPRTVKWPTSGRDWPSWRLQRYRVPLFRPGAPCGRALTVPRTVKQPTSGRSWPSWYLQRYHVPLFRPGAPCGRALTV